VSFLDRTTIRSKLIVLIGFTLLLMSGLGLIAVQRLSRVNQYADEVATNWLPSTGILAALSDDVMDYQRLVLLHLIATTPQQMAEYEKEMAGDAADIAKGVAAIEKLVAFDEERTHLKTFSTEWKEYLGYAAQVIRYSRNDQLDAARPIVLGQLNPRGYEATEAIERLTRFNVKMGDQVAKKSNAAFQSGWKLTAAGTGFGLLLAALGAFIIIRGVSGGIARVTAPMKSLAEGDLGVDVPFRGMKTEIGAIADSVQVFKDALIEKKRSDEAALAEAGAKAERARRLDELTAQFESKVGSLTQGLAAAATEMEATAQGMTGTAEDASRRTVAASAATEEASANVQTVAGAAEELSASIQEIAGQVSQASDIAGRAVSEAEATDATVQQLAEAAAKIGEVVQFISSIASQTNLLALNATIEAARAGEAGRGFAVVASEVKALAQQTAKATEDIAQQIGAIQASTDGAVGAIARINSTIREISEIASAIAAAVEEQRAATQEIARNVQEAATGTAEVSTNVSALESAASSTGAAASQVLGAAGELAQQSEVLSQEVGQFLSSVKAA
jgi:methyl-accepting chemotaxis protein